MGNFIMIRRKSKKKALSIIKRQKTANLVILENYIIKKSNQIVRFFISGFIQFWLSFDP